MLEPRQPGTLVHLHDLKNTQDPRYCELGRRRERGPRKLPEMGGKREFKAGGEKSQSRILLLWYIIGVVVGGAFLYDKG